MTEYYLHCNIVKCRKELKVEAWVTCCSHIFCMEHGQQMIEKQKCLACEYKFSNRYDIIMMDLNPSETHKNMLMAGLSPEKIFDIANRALIMWSYQIYQDRLFYESALRSSKEQASSVSDYYEKIIAEHKIETQTAQRKIDELKNVVKEKNQQMEDLITQLAEKTRLNKNLQTQYDQLNRRVLTNNHLSMSSHQQTSTYKGRNENYHPEMRAGNSPNNFTFDFISSPKQNNKQQNENFVIKPPGVQPHTRLNNIFGNQY